MKSFWLLITIPTFFLFVLILWNVQIDPPIPDEVKDFSSDSSRFEQADKYRYLQAYERAAKQYEFLLSNSTFLPADSLYGLNQIAYCYLHLHKNKEAKPWMSFADRIQKRSDKLIHNHLIADFYANKGRLHYLEFNMDSSRYFAQKALALYHAIGYENHLKTAQVQTLLALIHFENQALTDSCSYFALKASSFFQRSPQLSQYGWECDFALAATSLLNRAHERGELFCRRAITKLNALDGDNSLLLARCWSMLGRMLKKQGDALPQGKQDKLKYTLYREADSLCFPKAVSLVRNTNTLRIQEFYRDWIIHATRYAGRQKFDTYMAKLDSILLYQEDVYAHRDRLLGYFHFDHEEGDKDSCLYYYQKFINEHDEEELEVHLVDEAHFMLRQVFKQAGEYEKAIFYTESRIKAYGCCPENSDFYESSLIPKLDTTLTYCVLKYADIARILYQKYLEQPDLNTLLLANQYFALVERAYFPSISNADENTLLTYQIEIGNIIFPIALEAAVAAWENTKEFQWLDQAFRFMEHVKSYLLFRNLKKTIIEDDREYSDSLRLYQGAVNKYRYLIKQSQGDYFEEWEEVQNKLLNLLNQPERNTNEFIRNRMSKLPSLQEIPPLLAPKQSIIQYSIGDEYIYGMYISRDAIELFQIREKDKIISLIKTLRRILQSKNPHQNSIKHGFAQPAYQLYQALIGPVQKRLQRDQQLIIIPDGELNHLPFEVFLTEESFVDSLNFKHLAYLMHEIEILYSPSWKVFYNGLHRPFQINSLKNIGVWVDTSVFSSFPQRLIDHRPSNQSFDSYLINRPGSKEIFRKNYTNYDLIHMVMHGKSDSINREDNYMSFGPSYSDDLYGFELSRFHFRSALLVLAICQSGFGPVAYGEGAFSMKRFFLEAGVAQIVSTLWNVNQRSTDQILVRFYGHLFKSNSPSASLRAAKLDYLMQCKDHHQAFPSYWAGLVLTK